MEDKIYKIKNAENVIKEYLEFKTSEDGGENPYVVVGPAGGDSRLRIYCYGGLVGKIGDGESSSELMSETYAKYLLSEYIDGKETKYSAEVESKYERKPLLGEDIEWMVNNESRKKRKSQTRANLYPCISL